MNFGNKLLKHGKILAYTCSISDDGTFCEMYRLQHTNGIEFVVMCRNCVPVCW